MFTGLYASTAGMLAQMKNLDVIANNIANISTSGFKKDKSVFRSFYDDAINSKGAPLTSVGTVLRNRDLNTVPVIETITVDYNDGVIKQTGNVLDLAIQGDGFFELKGSDGETYFTRQGTFTLNERSEVVNAAGYNLMGEIGAITLPVSEEGSVAAAFTVDSKGNISMGQNPIDKLSMYRFVNNNELRKIGKSLFTNAGFDNVSNDPFIGTISQGHIELSNVNPISEMTEMITSSRAFEAYQRIISAIMNDTTEKSISLIGRV